MNEILLYRKLWKWGGKGGNLNPHRKIPLSALHTVESGTGVGKHLNIAE